MVWLSGAIEIGGPAASRHDFYGDIVLKKEDALVLRGSVIESETEKPTPDVLVELYARQDNGIEYPLCQTLSNDEGDYLLHVDRRRINDDIAAIILRASTTFLLSTP